MKHLQYEPKIFYPICHLSIDFAYHDFFHEDEHKDMHINTYTQMC